MKEKCRYLKDRLEMVAPAVSGTVRWCALKEEIIYSEDCTCEFEEPNALTTLKKLVDSIKLKGIRRRV